MSATTVAQTTLVVCPACGHRLVLHGLVQFPRERWCIAWDGTRFCGCTQPAELRP
jgi:hypothetical protein